jgi:HK97 gp10 family phage protein
MPDAFQVTCKVEGGDQLLKELAALGGNVRSTSRTAVRAGAKVIQAQAEVNAETIATRPAKHTQIKISQRVKGTIEAMIGPSKKKWFYRYFETGVTPHEITGAPLVFEGESGLVIIGGVQHPGLTARPWLRPAFDSKQGAAPAAVEDVFKKAIDARRAIVESGDDNGDD